MTADDRHLTPDRIAGYLASDLSPADRALVHAHLDHCAQCRSELVEVGEIVAAVRPASPRVRWRRLGPAILAVAAGLGALTVYQRRDRGDGTAVVRAVDTPGAGEGIPVIGVIEPADDAVAKADSVVLRWRSSGGGSYDVFVLAEDGRPVWTTTTPDTVVRVPPTVAVQPGKTYFWRVDAMGNGIVASSGTRRLTVTR